VKRLVASFVALLLVVAPALDAHPLHSSFTEITRERSGELKISIRLFSDDFGAALDSLRMKSSGSSLESVAQQYLTSTVTLMAGGKPLPLVWCGMRSDQGLTWVCARTSKPVAGSFLFRNSMMFDRFSDQLSIIRWTGPKETRTTILSARVQEVRLD
jgi:hypothetical protein